MYCSYVIEKITKNNPSSYVIGMILYRHYFEARSHFFVLAGLEIVM